MPCCLFTEDLRTSDVQLNLCIINKGALLALSSWMNSKLNQVWNLILLKYVYNSLMTQYIYNEAILKKTLKCFSSNGSIEWRVWTYNLFSANNTSPLHSGAWCWRQPFLFLRGQYSVRTTTFHIIKSSFRHGRTHLQVRLSRSWQAIVEYICQCI